MAYCVAQDVIDCCSWPDFGRLSAGAQQRLIDAASTRVDRVCRRPFGFAQQSVVETFDGRNQASLWLGLRPVISIAAVTIDGDAVDNSDGEAWTFDGATGRVVRRNGRDDPRFAPRWKQGHRNITVTYWGGYDPIPDDLVLATAYYVRYMHDQGEVGGAYARESIGGYTYQLKEQTMSGGVPDHVWALLAAGGYVQDDAF